MKEQELFEKVVLNCNRFTPRAMSNWNYFKDGKYDDPWLQSLWELCQSVTSQQAARIKEMEAMLEWQDISTAPRDGTWILLFGGKHCWDNYNGRVHEFPKFAVAFWDEEWWATDFWDGSWRSGFENPIHWMPLPKPPETKG